MNNGGMQVDQQPSDYVRRTAIDMVGKYFMIKKHNIEIKRAESMHPGIIFSNECWKELNRIRDDTRSKIDREIFKINKTFFGAICLLFSRRGRELFKMERKHDVIKSMLAESLRHDNYRDDCATDTECIKEIAEATIYYDSVVAYILTAESLVELRRGVINARDGFMLDGS